MPLKRKRRSGKFKKLLDENKNEPSSTSGKLSPQNEVVEKNKLNEIVNVTEAGETSKHLEKDCPITAQFDDNTSYPCKYCTEIFPTQTTFETHMELCSKKFTFETNGEFDKNKPNENGMSPLQISPSLTESNSTKRSHNEFKEPIIAPNGNTFYPCQYCSKIFPRETTCKTHMEKCSNKKKPEITSTDNSTFACQHCNKLFSVESECASHTEECLRNPNFNHAENDVSQNLNSSNSSVENIDPDLHGPSNTSENVDDPVPKKSKPDISIYDYDEEDSVDDSSKVNADVKCKVCPFIAESPIELLKHKREVHKVVRKILPPHEIQKYFDYPDRNFCPICEQPIKSRNFRSIFVKHLLVHTAGLTYECRICKKKFRRIDHMRAHERRHVLTYSELQAMQDSVDNTPVQLPLSISD